jgi:hypothetical protein
MKHQNIIRSVKLNGLCLKLFLFTIPAIILLSCAQEPQGQGNQQNPKEETLPVFPSSSTTEPSPSSTPSLTPTFSPTQTPYSTSTLSLTDISKVPERARMLVRALTKKEDAEQKWYIFPEGVMYHDIHVGDGKSITNDVAVHMLLRGVLDDGTEFVNTMKYKENKAYTFTFGQGDTLMSFEQGVASMREKGKRVIVIPPELSYGEKEYKTPEVQIPPHSTLIFEASVMWIRAPELDKLNLFK